ncbi:MAG: gamma-glutamyltransferase [Longimicrobiales bacterium]
MSVRTSAPALIASVLVTVPEPALAQNRPDVMGREAAVVASHPLAALAGAEVLRKGGNAIDAAISMAAVLAVVRPHMNGVGGDAFLLLRDGRSGKVQALNGSGRAGSLATAALFREKGLTEVPPAGILSVTVPGAVRAWADALKRGGTLTLAEALAPAIRLAEEGFPVSTKLATDIADNRSKIEADPALREVIMPDGEVPAVGSLLRQTDLARTLRTLAEEGPDALYVGQLARRIDHFMAAEGGLVNIEDMAAHSSTWQEPIWTTYGGFRVAAFPPNSQGAALLMMMNMAEQYELRGFGHNAAPYIHTLVEVKKLAYRERDRYITDPAFSEIPLERLLSKEFARQLNAELATRASGGDGPRGDDSGDTVFLCVVDKDGNAVSMIQSLFAAFGSGRMVPGTGILLHNRGSLFSVDTTDANVIAPNKRTFHTLAPSLALRPDGSLFMVFGTPGGDGQPQTLLQVFNNIVLFGMTPQQAVEASRWRSYGSDRLQVEPGIKEDVRRALEALGHRVDVADRPTTDFGGAQVIMIDRASGVRITGADPRREAYGIAW